MSSFNLKGLARPALAAALSVGLSLGLSGCFRPLYGPTASGASLQTMLSAIAIPETRWPRDQANFGHALRSELVYQLNGSGSDTPKRYVLNLSLSRSVSTPIVDSDTARATSAMVNGSVAYTLTSLDGGTVYARGTATSSTSYDRFDQPFGSIRAARDAEIRLAKVLAEQVKTRLAAALSGQI